MIGNATKSNGGEDQANRAFLGRYRHSLSREELEMYFGPLTD